MRNLASFLRFDDFSPLTTTETTRKKLKRGEDGEDLTDEFEEEKKKQTDEDIIVYYLTCAERGERPKKRVFHVRTEKFLREDCGRREWERTLRRVRVG